MNEDKDINLIAIKSLIECIDNRDIAEGGIFLDDDNAEFVADILRYHYKLLTSKNKMAEVARLFGKELGEEFTIKRSFGFDFEGHFSERGFVFWGEDATNNKGWYSDDGRLILELLTGEAVIVDD